MNQLPISHLHDGVFLVELALAVRLKIKMQSFLFLSFFFFFVYVRQKGLMVAGEEELETRSLHITR